MNWKVCGRKRSWPNLRYHPGILSEGLRKITKTSIMISGHRAEILTRDLPNTTRPRRWVRPRLFTTQQQFWDQDGGVISWRNNGCNRERWRALVSTVRVIQKQGKLLTGRTIVSFSAPWSWLYLYRESVGLTEDIQRTPRSWETVEQISTLWDLMFSWQTLSRSESSRMLPYIFW
jgi:hypothetical protein